MEIILSLSAYFTSALSTVFGMGGGIILLSIMLLFLPVEITIPLHGAVQFFSNFTRLILFYRYIQFRTFFTFAGAAIIGSIPGIYLFTSLDKLVVKILLGLFILYSVLRPHTLKNNAISQSMAEKIYRRLLSSKSFATAGFLAGSVSMIVGSAGPLVGPFFINAKFEKNNLIATEAICAAFVHLLKLFAFGFIGINILEKKFLVIFMSTSVIFGTITGKYLVSLIPEKIFQKIFKIVLGIIGAKIFLFDGLFPYIFQR